MGVQPDDKMIGYVTSGHHSLNEGKGAGIAAVSLKEFIELCLQAQRYVT